jgi:hypothetical protein
MAAFAVNIVVRPCTKYSCVRKVSLISLGVVSLFAVRFRRSTTNA